MRADVPEVVCETRAQWRTWLREHCEEVTAVWLVTRRQAPDPDYEAAVVEALAVGWVDSTKRSVDDDFSALYFVPRRRGSGWARTNKARIAALEATGDLHPRGAAVVAAARADGSWTLLDDVENLVVPDDLAAALDASGGREFWDSCSRSARRAMLAWLVEAKRPDTRARRVAAIAEHAGRGERPPQFR